MFVVGSHYHQIIEVDLELIEQDLLSAVLAQLGFHRRRYGLIVQ